MTDALDIRLARLEERIDGMRGALDLQAKEYERRLGDLNNEGSRIQAVLGQSVTAEKFEDYVQSETEKRELALQRVDEKFEDYVKRYEQRQREVDLLLAAQEGAVGEAKRAAEEQGRKSNRNVAILGVVLTAIIVGMNILGALP